MGQTMRKEVEARTVGRVKMMSPDIAIDMMRYAIKDFPLETYQGVFVKGDTIAFRWLIKSRVGGRDIANKLRKGFGREGGRGRLRLSVASNTKNHTLPKICERGHVRLAKELHSWAGFTAANLDMTPWHHNWTARSTLREACKLNHCNVLRLLRKVYGMESSHVLHVNGTTGSALAISMEKNHIDCFIELLRYPGMASHIDEVLRQTCRANSTLHFEIACRKLKISTTQALQFLRGIARANPSLCSKFLCSRVFA